MAAAAISDFVLLAVTANDSFIASLTLENIGVEKRVSNLYTLKVTADFIICHNGSHGRHLGFWNKSKILPYVCFYGQVEGSRQILSKLDDWNPFLELICQMALQTLSKFYFCHGVGEK